MLYNVYWDNVPALPDGIDPEVVQDLDRKDTPKRIRSNRGKSYGFWRDRRGGWFAITLIPTVPSVISARPWEFRHADGSDDGIDDLFFFMCQCDDGRKRVIAAPSLEDLRVTQ